MKNSIASIGCVVLLSLVLGCKQTKKLEALKTQDYFVYKTLLKMV